METSNETLFTQSEVIETSVLKSGENQVNPATAIVQESGIEQTKGQQLLQMFTPYFNRMAEIETKINLINKDNPTPEDVKIAREIRLALKNNRVASEKAKDESKAMILIEGRLIDNLNNIVKNTSKGLELQCEQIEKYQEMQEQKRKQALKEIRIELLSPYGVDTTFLDLLNMPEETFLKFLDNAKTAFEAKKEAEIKAEQQRVEKERRETLHRDRIAKTALLSNFINDYSNIDFSLMDDNEFSLLVQNAANKKKDYEAEQERIKSENERLKAEAHEKEKKMAEEKAKAEAAAAEIKAQYEREQSESQAKLKAEQQAKAKLEAELKAKSEAAAEEKRKEQARVEEEAKAKAEMERKASLAPDKDKLMALANVFDGLWSTLYIPQVNSAEAQKIVNDVKLFVDKISVFIKDNANKL